MKSIPKKPKAKSVNDLRVVQVKKYTAPYEAFMDVLDTDEDRVMQQYNNNITLNETSILVPPGKKSVRKTRK